MNLVWIEGTLCPRIAWTLVQFLWQGAALAVAANRRGRGTRFGPALWS